MEDYTLEEMSKEEGEDLTKELQEVLTKYNAEMGVTSNIQLLQRIPKQTQNDKGENKKTTKTKTD